MNEYKNEPYTATDILPYLDNVKQKAGNQWQANCPLCGDTKQHLYLKQANTLVMYCQHCNAKFTEIIAELEYRGVKRREKEQINYKTAKPTEDYYHVYRLPDGTEAFKKRRRKWADGHKVFSFEYLDNGKTIYKQPTNANKLYNLDKLYNADESATLYIVEGEKCADVLIEQGLLATTSSTGSKKQIPFTDTDKKALQKFADIVFIPDNDEKGSEYLEAYKDYAIKILDLKKVWEQCPKKGDIADYLQQGGDIEAIKNYQFPPKLTAEYINSLGIDQLMDDELLNLIFSKPVTKQYTYIAMAKARATNLKVTREFNNLLKAFKAEKAQSAANNKENVTKFTGQPLVLRCGEWLTDKSGVFRIKKSGNFLSKETVSTIPIMPVEILKNIETEKIHVTLAYGYNWQQRTIPKSIVCNANKIIELSDYDVDVTSDTAKLLSRYITDLINLNREKIPQIKAISRLGWYGNEFIPYSSNIILDNKGDKESITNHICSKGTLKEWVEFIKPLWKNNLNLRLFIAASLASVLIEKTETLSFAVHLWGGTGAGKTVALMVAASVWGNPARGKLVLTLNMTVNALMQTAATLYSIPLFGDELQTIKDKNNDYDKLIMQLTEGIERSRLDSAAKMQERRSWRNCFLFTGEEPIAQSYSGGGTLNRLIELECHEKVVPNGNEAVRFISEHYGAIGKAFINFVKEKPPKEILDEYQTIKSNLLFITKENCTEKQADAMALLALADCYLNEGFFHDTVINLKELAKLLKDKNAVDVAVRAYNAIMDIIAVNGDKFDTESHRQDEKPIYTTYWGRKHWDGTIYINKTILDQELKKLSFSFDTVKKKWVANGWLKYENNRYTIKRTLNGVNAYYAALITTKD